MSSAPALLLQLVFTPLLLASYFGHTEVVIVLLDRGADVNASNIVRAVGDSSTLPVNISVLSCTSARRQDGITPLHLIAYKGHAASASVVLDRGAAMDARDNVRSNERVPHPTHQYATCIVVCNAAVVC